MLCIYKRKIIKEKSEAINNQLKTGSKGGNLGERAGSSAERRRGSGTKEAEGPSLRCFPRASPTLPQRLRSRGQEPSLPLPTLVSPRASVSPAIPAPGAGMAGDTEARESPWVPPPLLTVA